VTTSSVAEFSRAMERAGRSLTGANGAATRAAAEVFRSGITATFAANGLRPGSKLAGTAWKGVLVKSLSDGRVEVKAATPAHLFNNPTSAHIIVAKGVGGSRRSRAARLGSLASRTVRADGVRYTQGSQVAFGPMLGFGGKFAGLRATKDSRRGKQALSFGGSHPVLYARHPGTKGKRSFGPGTDRARRPAAEAYMRAQRRDVLRSFTGL